MLSRYRSSQQLDILLNHIPVSDETDDDRITTVTVKEIQSGEETVLPDPYILDAIEVGICLS